MHQHFDARHPISAKVSFVPRATCHGKYFSARNRAASSADEISPRKKSAREFFAQEIDVDAPT